MKSPYSFDYLCSQCQHVWWLWLPRWTGWFSSGLWFISKFLPRSHSVLRYVVCTVCIVKSVQWIYKCTRVHSGKEKNFFHRLQDIIYEASFTLLFTFWGNGGEVLHVGKMCCKMVFWWKNKRSTYLSQLFYCNKLIVLLVCIILACTQSETCPYNRKVR